jgi:ribosomal-protein-alanine N-acetyltransferase
LHRGLVSVPHTSDDYRAYVERAEGGTQVSFLIVLAKSRELAGALDLLDLAAQPIRTARLGYYAFASHAGRGYVRAGVALGLERAFAALGLQSLLADIQPANRRSIALAESLGFVRLATQGGYRKVGRRWVEHDRWRLTRENWCGGAQLVPERA